MDLNIKVEDTCYFEDSIDFFGKKYIKCYLIKNWYKASPSRTEFPSSVPEASSLLNPIEKECTLSQKLFYESMERTQESPETSFLKTSSPETSFLKTSSPETSFLKTSSPETSFLWVLWKRQAYETDFFGFPTRLFKEISYALNENGFYVPITSVTYSSTGMGLCPGSYQVVEYNTCGTRKIKRWFDEYNFLTQFCIYKEEQSFSGSNTSKSVEDGPGRETSKESIGFSGRETSKIFEEYYLVEADKIYLRLKVCYKSVEDGPGRETSKESIGFSGSNTSKFNGKPGSSQGFYPSKEFLSATYFDEYGDVIKET